MKTIRTLLIPALLLGSFLSAPAEVIIEHNFDSDASSVGPDPEFLGHADTFVGIATKDDYEFAEGASNDSAGALVITGGDDEPDSWRPAVDFELPSMQDGYLKISFKIRNASFDTGDCVLQLWGVGEDPKKEIYYAYLRFTAAYVRASETGAHMFKDITTGADSEWHTVTWIVPLPGSNDVAKLEIDGDEYGNFKEPPQSDALELVKLRFFLQNNKTKDVQYAIDDLVVEHIKG